MKNKSNQKGSAMVGLLVMALFILAMALFNLPNLHLSNQVAYATGGGSALLGAGSPTLFPGYTSGEAAGTIEEDAVKTLQTASKASVPKAALKTTSELTAEKSEITAAVNEVVSAISTLSKVGTLNQHRSLAIAAVNRTLLRLITHTINVITHRIAVLSTQS